MWSQMFLLLSVGDSNQYKELDDVVFKSLVDMYMQTCTCKL